MGLGLGFVLGVRGKVVVWVRVKGEQPVLVQRALLLLLLTTYLVQRVFVLGEEPRHLVPHLAGEVAQHEGGLVPARDLEGVGTRSGVITR